MQGNEEKDLYEAIVEGDQAAFTLFYNKHIDRLSCRVFSVLKNKEHTEEVIQDVFCTLWNRRHEIVKIQNMEAYLYILARNGALNRIKAEVRRQKLEHIFFTEQEQQPLSIDAVSDQQYDELLDEAIAQLPNQQKQAFILSKFDRKKYLEIATHMNISRETVKKYLQLASASVKKHLETRKDSIISILFIYFIF